MKLLFIGGTGNISAHCVELALRMGGYEITVFNRAQRKVAFDGPVTTIVGDRHDRALLRQVAESGHYDVVADFIGYTPEEAEDDIRAFTGQTGQFIYISSVAAYQKPPHDYLMNEATPLSNPFWPYGQNKAISEEILHRAYRDQGFPVTIVRPWHTYGRGVVPTSLAGGGYTTVDRIRKGLPIVCHGDGQSLWGLTHSADLAVGFLGLCGNPLAIGEAFHITTDEILTWDQIYQTIARSAGVAEATLVHIASEMIARYYPQQGLALLGDLAYSSVYDNSKIKRYVPEYRTTVRWAQGSAASIAWMDADPARRTVDEKLNAMYDHLVSLQQSWLSV